MGDTTVEILVVDTDRSQSMAFLDSLKLPQANLTFVDKVPLALKNLRQKQYDLIILGDRMLGGDCVDICNALNGRRKNLQTPTVAVGFHKGRAAKVMKIRGPYAVRAEPNDFELARQRVCSYLEKKVS